MVEYPPKFAYMQPLAERCVLVGNRDDWAAFRRNMTDEDIVAYTDLYRRIRDNGHFDELEKVLAVHKLEEWRSQAWSLILALNYMIEDQVIPPTVAPRPLIEWDTREFDDEGNEW